MADGPNMKMHFPASSKMSAHKFWIRSLKMAEPSSRASCTAIYGRETPPPTSRLANRWCSMQLRSTPTTNTNSASGGGRWSNLGNPTSRSTFETSLPANLWNNLTTGMHFMC